MSDAGGGAKVTASPKLLTKQKPNPVPGTLGSIAFGCEHLHAFQKSSEKAFKMLSQQYNLILRTLHAPDATSKRQTVRLSKGDFRSTLRPSWLCIQCPHIYHEEGMKNHHEGPKAHSLFVESRSGFVYCTNCEDFIYDPTLEALRLRAENPGTRKRKYDEYTLLADASPLVTGNSTFVPCRAIGLRGLYNMGNTCFMSVVIQSLLHNPFIKTWYLSEGHKSAECERETCTSCALEEIFCEFWSGEKTEGYGAVPMLLSSWKSAEHLAGYQQQDAHEYMQFILNSLHTTNTPHALSPTTTSPSQECPCIIHKTFYGKLQSTVTCNECKNKTTALDPFMDLSLDLRTVGKKRKLNGKAAGNGEDGAEEMRLEECLSRFTGEERLPKEEYRCVKCERQRDATKQLSMRKLPPVLSVHLKRFSHTKDKSSKLETPVTFPLELDMVPYTTWAQTANPPNPQSSSKKPIPADTHHPGVDATYVLSAVIVHKGEINSGHYVSYAREGRDWFLFDDSKVVLVGEREVLEAQAYLLVYVAGKI